MKYLILPILAFWPFFAQIKINMGTSIPDISVLRVVVLFLIVTVPLRTLFGGRKIVFDFTMKCFVAFSLLFVVLSAINALPTIEIIQNYLDIFFIPISFYFVIVNTKDEISKISIILASIVSGVSIGAIGIAESIVGYNIYGPIGKGINIAGYYRTSGPFHDGITYAAILLFFIAFYLFILQAKKLSHPLIKYLLIGAVCICVVASVAQLSRACILVLVMILAVWFLGVNFRTIVIVYLLTLMFVVPLYLCKNKIIHSTLYKDRVEDISTMTGRYERYERLLHIYKSNPLLGIGYSNLSRRINPHNSYLQYLIEFGLFGFVFWLLLIFSPLLVLKKLSKDKAIVSSFNRYIISLLLLITLIPMTISALGSSYFMLTYFISAGIVQLFG